MGHPGLLCWEGLKATADPSATLGMTAFLIGWYAARHPEGTRPRPFKASPKRGSEVSHPCGKNKNAGPRGLPDGAPISWGMGRVEKQPQVLRLRYDPLRMTASILIRALNDSI